MHLRTFLFQHLLAAAASMWLLPPVIILSTVVLEDVTIALVGILAADHQFPLILGIASLIAGIVIGDSLAFLIGRLAIRHRFARRIVEHEHIAPLKTLLTDRPEPTIFTTRFMPGFRMAMFMACGFFSVPYRRFLPMSAAGAVVWASLLSVIAYLFGYYTLHLLGIWRWPILALFLAGFLFFGHRYWRKVTRQAAEQAETSD